MKKNHCKDTRTTDNFNASCELPKTPPKTTDKINSSSSLTWIRNQQLPNELKKNHCKDTSDIYIPEYPYDDYFNIIITSHVLKHINTFNKKCIEDIYYETEKKNLENFVISLVNDAISKGIYDVLDNKGRFTKGRFTHDVDTKNQYCIVGEWKKNKEGKRLYKVYTIYKCSGRYLTPDYEVY